MKIRAYADTMNGCHICLDCATDQEKKDAYYAKDGSLYPLTLSELYDIKYADYHLGISEKPNTPSCDRCLKAIPASVQEIEGI